MSIKITFEVETPEEGARLLQRLKTSSTTNTSQEDTAVATTAAPAAEETSSKSTTTTKETSENTEPSPTSQTEPDLLISAAVKKYAAENGVDPSTVEGTGKEGRILKKDITAAIEQTEDEPEVEEDDDLGVEEDDDLFGDLEDDEPAATKEDVRKAMVALQTAIREKYIANGDEEDEAKKKAINTARKVLKQISGSETLGGIDEDKYADVVAKANAKRESIQ